jgi:hypothetical protein
MKQCNTGKEASTRNAGRIGVRYGRSLVAKGGSDDFGTTCAAFSTIRVGEDQPALEKAQGARTELVPTNWSGAFHRTMRVRRLRKGESSVGTLAYRRKKHGSRFRN